MHYTGVAVSKNVLVAYIIINNNVCFVLQHTFSPSSPYAYVKSVAKAYYFDYDRTDGRTFAAVCILR